MGVLEDFIPSVKGWGRRLSVDISIMITLVAIWRRYWKGARDATGRRVRRLWPPRDRGGAWAGRGAKDRGPGMESMNPD